MPIYAYKCDTCGHTQDVLRKISDPPLEVCPKCGESTFTKQVTAAGFQLKGSGWYVSDFRSSGDGANSGVGKEPATKSDASAPAVSATPAAPAPAPAPAATTAPAASRAPSTAS